MTRLLLSLLFSVAISLASSAASAQSTLAGRIVDPQGRPVPGATVVAVGATSAPLSAATDEQGRFEFSPVADGLYDITASAPGMTGDARGVRSGATAALEIALHLVAVAETLVVSASQIDQPLSRTADSVTIITGRELESRQVTTLGGALSTVPGFTVARTGGPGTLTSLFPRGGESDFTLVLIDGVRANAFGGGADLSQVLLTDVRRRRDRRRRAGGHATGWNAAGRSRAGNRQPRNPTAASEHDRFRPRHALAGRRRLRRRRGIHRRSAGQR
jgi:outer membrane receptor protein involved in Fe transport